MSSRAWSSMMLAASLVAFAGACLSTSGLDDGGPVQACTGDLQTDVANCGACGNACASGANAATTCTAGKCGVSCNAGALDCNGDTSDGCEAIIASDAKNCGSCGHDCFGGACTNAVCQATTIQAVTGQPSGIVADDSAVYFGLNPPGGTTSEVVRMAKDGSSAQPLVLNRSNVSALALDDTFVYWVEVNGAANGRILKVPKDGSSSTPQTVSTSLAVTSNAQLVVTSSNAVWSAYGVDDGSGTGTLTGGGVYRCALAGCGATPDSLANLQAVNGVATDSTSFYFGLDPTTPGPGVFDCPSAGCSAAPAQVPGAGIAAIQLAIDADAVYWTTGTEVARFVKASSSLSIVASGLAGLHAIVVDSNNVYFTSTSVGIVYGCPRTGCPGAPVAYASGLTTPSFLGQDTTALYVTSGSASSGAVSRIAK